MEKTHPKYVTGRCVHSAAITPHGSLRHDFRSWAGGGGGYIDQPGRPISWNRFFYVFHSCNKLFILQKHSKRKQCKFCLCACLGNSEMAAAFPHPEAQRDERAEEQQCWIPWLHTPPEPVQLLQSLPEKLLLCHNTLTISSCWESLSLLLPCHLPALSSSARVTPPASHSSSYLINSSLCISLLVYLLGVQNAFTASLSMKRS